MMGHKSKQLKSLLRPTILKAIKIKNYLQKRIHQAPMTYVNVRIESYGNDLQLELKKDKAPRCDQHGSEQKKIHKNEV